MRPEKLLKFTKNLFVICYGMNPLHIKCNCLLHGQSQCIRGGLEDVRALYFVAIEVLWKLHFTTETPFPFISSYHYSDVIMNTMASQISSLTMVYSTVYLGADQRKHQSSASLAFVRGSHRGPVNSPRKWPVTRKIFPFDDVIMVI